MAEDIGVDATWSFDVHLAETIRSGVGQNIDKIVSCLNADEVLNYLEASMVFRQSGNWEDFQQKIRAQSTGSARARALLEAVFDRDDSALVAFLQAAHNVHAKEEFLELLVASSKCKVSGIGRWTELTVRQETSPREQAVIGLLHRNLVKLYENAISMSCDYDYLPEKNALKEYYVDTDILEVKKEEALRIMGVDRKDSSRGRRVWADATRRIVHLRDLLGGKDRLRSLVIGVPGAGKSRLCLELCQQWASGLMLRSVRFLFLLQARELSRPLSACRFPESDANWLGFLCLPELAVGDLTEEEQAIAWKYLRSHSEEVLILLDGLDELDAHLLNSQNSYLYQIVHHRVLPLCTLLITSRPCEKVLELVHWTDKHYQIKGMSAKQLRGMKKKWLGEEGTCELERQLAERPQVKNAITIPLVATMVLGIFLKEHELPYSLGECYEVIVTGFLHRYAERSLAGELGATPKIHNLGSCPIQIRKVLTGLEDIALDLLLGHSLVFSLSDVKKVCSLDVLDSGLLVESRKRSYRHGYETRCEFIHSTFQEYLAARAVGRSMNRVHVGNCIKTCLMIMGTDLNTHSFWLFLADMLHVDHLVKLLQALHQSVENGSFIQRKNASVLVLHSLAQRMGEMADSQEFSVSTILASKSNSLDASHYQLSDGDFGALTRVLHSSTGLRKLHLVDCCMNAARCKELVQCNGLKEVSALDLGANVLLRGEAICCLSQSIIRKNMAFTVLSFQACFMSESDASCLGQLINSQKRLTSLNLSSNYFFDAGVKDLAKGFHGCTALEELNLEKCDISADGAAEVAKVFSGMPSLKTISFRRNPLGNRGACFILQGLASNKRLSDVGLHFTGIDDALCNCLEEFVRKHAAAGRGSAFSCNQLSLGLTGNKLNRQTCHKLQETIAGSCLGCDITIDLGYCMIDAGGIHELNSSVLLSGEALPFGKYNERDIGCQGLGELGAQQLGEIVRCIDDAECLCLENNNIGDEILKGIAPAIAGNHHLLALDLSQNVVTFDGVLSLAAALCQCNFTLRYLNLQENSLIGEEHTSTSPSPSVVSKSLKLLLQCCPRLQFLGFTLTGLRNDELRVFCCHLLPESPLVFLALSGNKITDDGVEELCRTLVKNKKLRILLLRKNRLTDKSAAYFARLQDTRLAGALDIIGLMKIPPEHHRPGMKESMMDFKYSMEILDVLDSLSGLEN